MPQTIYAADHFMPQTIYAADHLCRDTMYSSTPYNVGTCPPKYQKYLLSLQSGNKSFVDCQPNLVDLEAGLMILRV